MITGDSKEYEFFDEAIQLLKNPIGVSVETILTNYLHVHLYQERF